MTQEHTPTPWRVGGVAIFGEDHHKTQLICAAQWTWQEQVPQAQANAEFIVKAVNNFESLLAALKGSVMWMEDGRDNAFEYCPFCKGISDEPQDLTPLDPGWHTGQWSHDDGCPMVMIEAAIADAEGSA